MLRILFWKLFSYQLQDCNFTKKVSCIVVFFCKFFENYLNRCVIEHLGRTVSVLCEAPARRSCSFFKELKEYLKNYFDVINHLQVPFVDNKFPLLWLLCVCFALYHTSKHVVWKLLQILGRYYMYFLIITSFETESILAIRDNIRNDSYQLYFLFFTLNHFHICLSQRKEVKETRRI